jgi:hypothetical protein
MGYEVIVSEKDKTIEIHSDICDILIDKKDNYILNNELFYINFNLYEEIEEFLKEHSDFTIQECEICKPKENKEELDEEYDDFYEEFAEDEDIDNTRCDIF